MNSEVERIEKPKLPLLTNFLCISKFLIRIVPKLLKRGRQTQHQTFYNSAEKPFMKQYSKNLNLNYPLHFFVYLKHPPPPPPRKSVHHITLEITPRQTTHYNSFDVRKYKSTGGGVVTGTSSPAAVVHVQSLNTIYKSPQ